MMKLMKWLLDKEVKRCFWLQLYRECWKLWPDHFVWLEHFKVKVIYTEVWLMVGLIPLMVQSHLFCLPGLGHTWHPRRSCMFLTWSCNYPEIIQYIVVVIIIRSEQQKWFPTVQADGFIEERKWYKITMDVSKEVHNRWQTATDTFSRAQTSCNALTPSLPHCDYYLGTRPGVMVCQLSVLAPFTGSTLEPRRDSGGGRGIQQSAWGYVCGQEQQESEGNMSAHHQSRAGIWWAGCY